jgi:hypothetical protein
VKSFTFTTEQFWMLFRGLPCEIRRQAQAAHAQFQRDPFYPGLHFEEVDQSRNLWSARITRGYRVLGIREDGGITWLWIGSHRE